MAKKKKNKIVVELDLPKDDSTLTKLYAILFVSILLGLCTAIVWSTNSGFIPTTNGEPMFTNVYCGATAKDSQGNSMGAQFQTNQKPSYAANESCAILKDEPDVVEWVDEEWTSVSKRGKNFDVPGIDSSQTGGVAVAQPLWANCSVSADIPTEYTIAIRSQDGDIINFHNGTTDNDNNPDNDNCYMMVENIPADTRYEFLVFSNEEGKQLSKVTFDVTVHYFDGIPANMNNKSYWIGPEVSLGPKDFRPFIFLNFFGMSFFFFLYPASWYWERVEFAKNEVEEKFPDFFEILPSIGKVVFP